MTTEELVVAVRVTAENAEETLNAVQSALTSLASGAAKTGDSMSDLVKQAQKLTRQLQSTTALKSQVTAYKDLAKQVQAAGGSWDDLSDEVKAFGKHLGVADGDIDGMVSGLSSLEGQLDASLSGGVADLQALIAQLEAARAKILAIPPAEITADNTQALSAINAAIAAANILLALFGKAGITPVSTGSSGSRGGGGGGSSSAASDAAASAQRAAEEAYQAEIERIEHRRHMGEITAQEEIAELERVKREYTQTAEQIMDIDERIYDARQALRESEQDKITALHDALMDALEARYEAQREIEQQRISESIAAWEKWSDETCAAIQKQIDALDEQAEAEDREKTRAENLRKIDSLEQALEYETDEYNQSQLKRQIEQAKAAWEEIQADWARADQKAALQAQMQAVQDQANAEIDRLEAESERIDSVYDALTDSQALYAEAQKQMMQSSQEELLGLLAEYAPDYEAAGRTLGEKLYEGFAAAFGDITAYFSDLDAQFEQMAQNTQQTALGRSEAIMAQGEAQAAVSAPVISQTVIFNEPVESPADITRRMQQVSEQLAGMI